MLKGTHKQFNVHNNTSQVIMVIYKSIKVLLLI